MSRPQHGSAAVELAVLAPVLVVMLLFVVAVGRLVLAHQEVDAAAADAARAASIASSAAQAQLAAMEAASDDLAGHGVTCASLTAKIDTADFTPGGAVSVQLSCSAKLSGLALLALPGSETLSSQASAPIDLYRQLSSP
ncbi:MAG TPA: TadE/TadG family type IV pilus assembly protein [Acidimicrobiales bacterium]|nr:TadE/TadG family type IV pilus assembly protein [Acidimicrobiales bacterium]